MVNRTDKHQSFRLAQSSAAMLNGGHLGKHKNLSLLATKSLTKAKSDEAKPDDTMESKAGI